MAGYFKILAPMLKPCQTRHVSVGAYGTSHGFHRHRQGWHTLIAGYK